MNKPFFIKKNNLIPTIIQEEKSRKVLMLGYMNKEAIKKTLQEGLVYFWSRERKKLWMKGEESGNRLKVLSIITDCDNDALLLQAKLIGKNVCHKGSKSCFTQRIL